MGFLNPWALALGALAGVIVVMYLLKLKRRREVIPSTLLWLRSVEDLIANAPFQRLRQKLLMYLQIAVLLALAFALARPTLWLCRAGGVSRIVIVDTSASMSAMDGAPESQARASARPRSRLQAAQDHAARLAGNLARGDQMMLISSAAGARVEQPMTAEPGLLRGAIARLAPTDTRGNLREALELARGVRQLEPSAVVTIISDGAVGYLGELLGKDVPIEFIAVGRSAENRGFVAFDLRASFEQRGKLEAFAEVQNFGAAQAAVLVRCLIDGELNQARELTLAPGGRQGLVFSDLPSDARHVLRLELAPADSGAPMQDLLAADDAVQGIIEPDRGLPVLLVSTGNFFLERMLTLLPGARVKRLAPADYERAAGQGLVVFDHAAPATLGPGQYLFLNAVPPLPGFAAGPQPLKNQALLDWNRLHPVTRFVGFESLMFGQTLDLKIPPWATTLVESPGAPLVVAGEQLGTRLLVIAFDLYASDWPLQVSFPVFFANAARWLAGSGEGGDARRAPLYRTGETIALAASGPLRVTDPRGRVWPLEPAREGTAWFDRTLVAGLYQVAGDAPSPPAGAATQPAPGAAQSGQSPAAARSESRAPLAVNLLAPEESAIAPRPQLETGQRAVQASAVSMQNREIWPWIALAALLLLAIEWQIYCRRAWV